MKQQVRVQRKQFVMTMMIIIFHLRIHGNVAILNNCVLEQLVVSIINEKEKQYTEINIKIIVGKSSIQLEIFNILGCANKEKKLQTYGTNNYCQLIQQTKY